MNHQPKTWIVAYDIREPRRLRRVYRLLRKEGLATQYSVYTVEADAVQITGLLARVRTLIDPRVDDVRAYHLPERCTVWSLGAQAWPDGLCLTGTHAARLLADLHTTDDVQPALTDEPSA